MKVYDVVVIGGGAAGLVSSKLSAGLGKKVLLIEKKRLGGECSYSGCIPSKAFIHTASLIDHANEAKKYFELGINPGNLLENGLIYAHSIIQKMEESHKPEILKDFGIDVIFGIPEFIDPYSLLINNEKIRGKKFILATGSSPFIPDIEGLQTVPYLTNENFFLEKTLPRSIIVLGGGAIGIELAQAMNRLGVATTVVEMTERILPREESELVEILEKKLTREGIKIITGTKAVKVQLSGNNITVTVKNSDIFELQAEKLLVCVGRKPNIDGLKLENAGVKYTGKGITTNRYLQTDARHIYACGDVAGPYQFSHIAEYQAVIAAKNAILPFKSAVNYKNVLWVTFTDPELAHLGLTEEEASALYHGKEKVYRYPYSSLDRGITDSKEEGLAKFIITPDGKIAGVQILGAHAGELIHEAQILKTLNVRFSKIQNVIHAYPTFSDITRQTGKKVYINELTNNFFIKMIKKLTEKK